RLPSRGGIALVVAAATVAGEVDDDVAVEFLPVFEGQARRTHDRLGIIAVDVEDRGVDRLRHVRAVERRPRRGGGSGEPDLVVDDHMQGYAGEGAAPLQ